MLPNMNTFCDTASEEVCSQDLTMLHNVENSLSPITPTNYVKSKWLQASLHVMTNNPTKYEQIPS
jgi:hypothetical protein